MKKLLVISVIAGIALLIAACGQNAGTATGTVIKSGPAGNNLTVVLSNTSGVMKNGENDFFISFKDGSGKPVDVGAAAITFHMPAMGTMGEMNSAATLTTTGTPGVYQGKAKLEMTGDWQAQISYEGPAGKGKMSLTATVR